MQIGDVICHNEAFLEVGKNTEHLDGFPGFFFRENRFANLLCVFVNQTIGCIDNGLCGTIVLLQLKDLCMLVGTFELQNVIDISSAE